MKKIISVILAAVMLLTLAPVSAFADDAVEGVCGDGLTWSLDGEGKLTIAGSGAMTDFASSASPFYGRSDILSVEIGEGVTSIGDNAFSGCAALAGVTIPGSVESIGYKAFNGCAALAAVTVPGSVGAIGQRAFYKCTALADLTIENGVGEIGDYAFYQCGLTEVTFPGSVAAIGASAFKYCRALGMLTIENGVGSIGDYAFESCASLAAAAIPASVTSIGDMAFFNCTSLADLTVPDTVTAIGSSAFDNTAYYYDAANWTDGVLYVGGHLLEVKANALPASLVLRAGTKTIAEYAFSGCSGLVNVTFPDGLESISDSAFSGCTGLTNIRISADTVCIEHNAFYNCGKLKDVYYLGSQEQWNGIAVASGNTAIVNAVKHFDTDPAAHVWDAGTVTTAPKCEEDGVKTFACVFCDAVRTEPVPAIGHAYGAWTKLDGATHQRVCANDPSHTETAAHSWGPGVVTKAATCTAKGVRTYTCTVCGAKKTASIAATGHNYGAWTKLDASTHRRVCANDPSHIETGEHTWDEGVVTKAATTTATGVRTYTCAVCLGTKTETIPKALAKIVPTLTNAATGVKVAWPQDVNSDGYIIYRKTGTGSYAAIKKITTNATVAYTDTTVVFGTEYTYAVRSYRGSEKGAYAGASITFLSMLTPTLANAAGGVSVKWNKVAGAEGYYIYRKTGTGSYAAIKKIASNATVAYTDKTVASGTKYTYAVRAYKGSDKGSFTAKSITFLSALAPTLENTAEGVSVQWPLVTGAEGYIVYRKSGESNYSALEKIASNDTTAYTDRTATSGTEYTYAVRAYKGSERGAFTEKSIAFLTALAPTASCAMNGVKIKWTKDAGAEGYRIYRKSGSESFSEIKEIASNTTVSFVDTTVVSGTTYTYAVRSYKGADLGASAESSVLYLTGLKPTLANAAGGVTVNWTQVGGADGYYVYRRTVSGSFAKIATIKSGSTVSYTDAQVKSDNGTAYAYAVRAYQGGKAGAYTEKQIIRLTGIAISSLTNSAAGTMNVKWAKNESSSGYQIQYAANSSFSGAKTVTVKYATTLSKNVASLTKGTTYYVRIRAYATDEASGANSYSAWSAAKTVKIAK